MLLYYKKIIKKLLFLIVKLSNLFRIMFFIKNAFYKNIQ